MRTLTPHTTRRLLAACGVSMALLAPTSLASASAPSSPTLVGRIVIASDQAALVLDANRLSVIDTIPVAARPGLSAAGDGRHVFLTPSGKGMVQILDTGAPTAELRVTQPHLERGVLAGVTPGHVVGEHGRTAVFDDGTGVIQVVADADLSAAVLTVRAMAPYPAHHGVTVPMAKGFLTSVPAAGSTARIGVARIRENGTVAARWDTCPGLHGEGHAKGGVVAFGCDDGIFVYRSGAASKIAEPAGVEGRVSTLAASEDSPILAGNFTATSIVLADTQTMTTRLVELGMDYGSFGRDDEGQVVVLGTDGALHRINPLTGEVAEPLSVIPAWTKPTDYTVARPVMSIDGHRAYVTDPAARTVTLVDLETGKILRRVTLAVTPANVLAGGHGH